jgi:hypothetical protein
MIPFKLLACAAAATQAQAAIFDLWTILVRRSGAISDVVVQSYYNDPTATAAQPQPVISDPVLVRIYAVSVNRRPIDPCSVEQSLPFRAH